MFGVHTTCNNVITGNSPPSPAAPATWYKHRTAPDPQQNLQQELEHASAYHGLEVRVLGSWILPTALMRAAFVIMRSPSRLFEMQLHPQRGVMPQALSAQGS